MIYDVHHHRCLPDGCSVAGITRRAMATWNREPVFHLSSPKDGWDGPRPARPHDLIDPPDIPPEWLPLQVTVEVEAKHKEVAIRQLQRDLSSL
jgi:UV DNA damage endonuclease